jgi:[pyruvate, water dikinase]-phosphate phosphotransferase / [pyruvate, water dikinase] kinase
MSIPPIYIVSGGSGSSGQQLTQTALAQFPDADIEIIVIAQVQRTEQLDDVVARAAATGGTIVHTLVDAGLRGYLVDRARVSNVSTIDPMGPLLMLLARKLQRQPLGQPGLFRKLREDYFKRVAAIEFAVDHDDGKRVHELHLAEIVLVGVSRVGKTPLSMYLATQGWKAANVPLVKGIAPPQELYEIDNRRVVGLTIEPGQLIAHRKVRQQRLGTSAATTYTGAETIYDEVEAARSLFRQGQFATVDVTDRPVEETAEEVIARVIQRLR